MSKPSQHKQLMERLDKLIDTLEQGNAIAVARLQVEVQEAKKNASPTTKKLIASADDQIKAVLEAQLARQVKGE